MKHTIKHYFLSSNSSKGYISFESSALAGLSKVIKLTGYSPEMMKSIAEHADKTAQDMGYELELIHNPLDNSIEGILIPENKSCIINKPLYLANRFHVFNLFFDTKISEIIKTLSEAHIHFETALKIHDQWEKIYISNMDFNALNRLTEETLSKLFPKNNVDGKGERKDRYFGAATYNGATDYISNITEGVSKRYFIKGRPGTGKSTFLKKLANRALEQGFDTEIYHCAFDPDSLDLIIIPCLDVCLFDSTAPHEYFPSRDTDEIIDIYEAAVNTDTDERYADELLCISIKYKKTIASATYCLSQAKMAYDELNQQISKDLDSTLYQDIITHLVSELFS